MDLNVQMIYRKADERFFSIEKVFSTIVPYLGSQVTVSQYFVSSKRANLKAIWQNIRDLKKIKGSVYHITGDVHYAVFAFKRKKTILTIHDCVFLESTSGLKRLLMKKIWLDWPVKWAGVITTISEKTKKEIIDNTGCNPQKIKVIANPVSQQISFSGKPFNAERPTILFIGTRSNKNLPRAIEALKNINCHLEIIGELNAEQVEHLAKAGISYKAFQSLSDKEMADKYQDCDMVLFPSLYEGFGLPVIEGQKAGKPVITSNISPMKEVAGDAALLIDPLSVASIRDAVIKLIADKQLRASLTELGQHNISRYAPETIANQYIQLYKDINKTSS